MGWSHSYRIVHRERDRGHRHRDGDRAPRAAHVRHLSVRPDLTAGTATVVISGELDLLSTPSLAEHLDQILASSPRRLVFDMSRVGFIDCAAARLIAGTEASLPGDQRPVLRRPAPEVRRVFELTGLDARCEMDAETDRLGRHASRATGDVPGPGGRARRRGPAKGP
jgi:anti-anti-sigma factor